MVNSILFVSPLPYRPMLVGPQVPLAARQLTAFGAGPAVSRAKTPMIRRTLFAVKCSADRSVALPTQATLKRRPVVQGPTQLTHLIGQWIRFATGSSRRWQTPTHNKRTRKQDSLKEDLHEKGTTTAVTLTGGDSVFGNGNPEPTADGLYFLPLGGSGVIGMNLNLYYHKGKWLMVDLGCLYVLCFILFTLAHRVI